VKALRYLGIGLVAVAVAAVATGAYLLGGDEVPARSDFALDLAELRRLAGAVDGPLPVAVDSELVAVAEMPRALLMAGEGFDAQPMVHPVFRVHYPDGRFVLIDTALDADAARDMGADRFREDAFARVVEAMSDAWRIVLTHEHQDHIGGAARHPEPERLVGRLLLTREQYESRDWLETAGFPDELHAKLEPLDYETATAIGPGIVLHKAPGHTPGSQLVFVTLADGRELLFVGDVAWCREALEELRYRPRITTLVLGEERARVLDQFRALHDLLSNDRVRLVVSHEPGDREAAGIRTSFGG